MNGKEAAAPQKSSNRLDGVAPGGWRTVAVLWFAFALNYVDRQIVFVIYPALRHDLGFTDAQLGLAGALFLWVYSLAMPLAGVAADVFPRTRMVVASVVLWSAATVGSGLSGSIPVFLGWRVLTGLTEALYFPAAISLIRQLHPDETRSRALSLHATAQFAGIVIGGSYGAWMAQYVGWRIGFVLIGGLGVVYASVLTRALREPAQCPEPVRPGTPRSRNRLSVLRSWCYCVWSATFLALCAMLWLFFAWFPDTLHTRHHLSVAESGVYGTAFLQGSSVAGILAGGFLADRWSRRVPAARFYLGSLGITASAPFAWFAFAAESLPVSLISVCAFGFFAGWMIANVFAAVYDVVPLRHSGFAAGLLNMLGGMSGAAMIFIAGLARTTISLPDLVTGTVEVMAFLGVLTSIVASRRCELERRRAV